MLRRLEPRVRCGGRFRRGVRERLALPLALHAHLRRVEGTGAFEGSEMRGEVQTGRWVGQAVGS